MSDDGAVGEERPVLSVRNLVKHFPITEGVLRREVGRVRAVDGISFDVYPGETLGLVGESGCGKSTAALSLLRLEEPTDGEVSYRGESVTDYDSGELKAFRREAQMIFQDPTSSFDPRMPVGQSVAEPLLVHGMADRRRRRGIVENLLERVGLSASDYDRYPHEFSGGQKQRIAIARALVVNPDLVVADEPVSALDVSVQAEILGLLEDVQDEFGLSILFISHDMAVVREVCDRVAVMYLGEIVETGPTVDIFEEPQHPYTRALLASVPSIDPRRRGEGVELSGDVPSPSNPPAGCRFHTRCPEIIQPEGYDFDQQNWRAVMDLRVRLEQGTLDLDAAREFAVAEGEATDPEAVTREELARAVRDEFSIPPELTDHRAERVLQDALSSLVDGEADAARDLLADEFETICEREHPDLRDTEAGHPAACHLHREAVEADAVRSQTPED
ncbi:ABC transporter ATP-binding protein [Halorussus ruber]|uniref:ABC transporter ATP-binding protein n=1 Tax=Halorussus ruber TaxID=1126238 RepID=UPI00109240A9|nr:oligopeptide/dipeptide ABC transporter ATP-binding protein [Halorussus ruber]